MRIVVRLDGVEIVDADTVAEERDDAVCLLVPDDAQAIVLARDDSFDLRRRVEPRVGRPTHVHRQVLDGDALADIRVRRSGIARDRCREDLEFAVGASRRDLREGRCLE